MAIAPLQLPGAFQSPSVDLYGGLSSLGEVFKKAQNQQKLSDLGKGLAAGTIDYRTAAGQVADMGDVTHTLQFLALAEQQKKQADELAASEKFTTGLSSLYGGQPGAAPPTSSPMPVPGAPANVPAATAPVAANRAPVMPTAKVWGDKEAEDAGIYEKPVQVASLAPTTATDAGPGVPLPAARPPGAPGAQPVAVAQASPAAAPVAAAPSASGGLPSGITPRAMALIGAAGSPRLPQTQRELAKTLLTSELDSGKATSEMKEWAFAKSQDPNTPDYTTWARANKAAGKPEVNVDTKGEGELSKTLGKGLGTRINDIAAEGDAARTDLAMVGQLRDLGAAIKTGGPAAIQGWLAGYGIKVGDNVGAVEAYGSMLDKMAPAQRVPGSGSSSDVDVKMFKSALPRLINTPEGNAIIETTFAGVANYKLERAAIADKVQAGEMTAKDGLKAMRDLPNPYDNFKTFAKTGFKADPSNPATAAPPQKEGAAKQVPFTKVEIDQSLSNARAAITANPGARAAIIKKLRDNGLPTDGL